MIHLIEPTHSKRFVTLLDEHYPIWREARTELNELPLWGRGVEAASLDAANELNLRELRHG